LLYKSILKNIQILYYAIVSLKNCLYPVGKFPFILIFCRIKLNTFNGLMGEPEKDALLKLGNGMKASRLKSGHLNFK
jgi:hypothetical protein